MCAGVCVCAIPTYCMCLCLHRQQVIEGCAPLGYDQTPACEDQ